MVMRVPQNPTSLPMRFGKSQPDKKKKTIKTNKLPSSNKTMRANKLPSLDVFYLILER
jgi:hypothetical protein